jgi:DNA-binding transcriptional ArsR family regulator
MLGDPSRAAMLLALMDGRSRSAKKLALDAGVTPQTASAHLKKLVAANLIHCEAHGRTKEFRLRGAEVAQALEALSELDDGPVPPAARELRFARCCYDHLAGELGVRVTERLLEPGNRILAELGIEPVALPGRRAPFRCCTDWTERRPHIAGAVGAALLRHYLERRWLLRAENSRKLVLTELGRETVAHVFGIASA